MRRSIPFFLSLALIAIAASAALAAPAKPKLEPKPASPASGSASASSAMSDKTALAHAQELYTDAKFEQAVKLLTAALHDGLILGDDVNKARELRARALVKLGRRVEAKEGFKTILRSDEMYRPDHNAIPPDEMDVFRLSFREYQSEQVEAGKRHPASIGAWYGTGQAVNQDLVDLASSAGVAAADDFKASAEFGYSVRLPIKPRWSMEFEISRLRAETQDKLPPTRNAHTKYEAYETPIIVSILRDLSTSPQWHLSAFGGVGLIASEAVLQDDKALISGRIIPTQIIGRSTGFYAHIGVEAEYRLQPRLSIAGRVLARSANAGKLKWPRDDFEVYESYPVSTLGSRNVDFSGIAAHVGVRAYIGY